jgi:hypothetical protein
MSLLKFTGLLAFSILFLACNKKQEVNPFENATLLDCNNLRVKKVELVELEGKNTFQVDIESTCLACKELAVYETLFMISEVSNDTIATSCQSCLAVPNNRTTSKYLLDTDLATMPDVNEIRFSMRQTCNDIAYKP